MRRMGQNRPHRAWTRLVAALALAIQVFVIQTHVDGFAYADTSAAQIAQSQDQHGPLGCVICEAAATAQTGITPTPPVVTLLEASIFVASASPALPVLESRPSLPWQSRAPPLHA